MNFEKPFLTAADLAALFGVDLSTVHDWVNRGRIRHFRTPGRHLRFEKADAAAFLAECGFPVPAELTPQDGGTASRAAREDRRPRY